MSKPRNLWVLPVGAHIKSTLNGSWTDVFTFMSNARAYITTPIYYVNGDPHIGNAFTSVMGDVLKRAHTLSGSQAMLTTGTDEHGQKNEESAAASGLTTEAFLERQSMRFRAAFDELNVGYDFWVRTSLPAHKDVVTHAVSLLYERDLLVKKEYDGLYCVACEQFKPRAELDEEGRCLLHLTFPMESQETNYFLALEPRREWLRNHIEANDDWILPRMFRDEVLQMLAEPLPDLCISRPKNRVGLGVELPFDSEYVTYVWFDALINYVSSIDWPGEDYLKWWGSSTHLMGKDIIKTHCVYWPIILNYLDVAPPAEIRVHGFFVASGGHKMSKSLDNVVSPVELIDLVGVDGVRYYMTKSMRGNDTPITRELVADTYMADLANNVGNLLSRIISLSRIAWKEEAQPSTDLDPEDAKFLHETFENVSHAWAHPDLTTLADSVAGLTAQGKALNKIIEDRQPWVILRDPERKEEYESLLTALLESIRILIEGLWPVVPASSRKAIAMLGLVPPKDEDRPLAPVILERRLERVSMEAPEPVFPRLES